MARGGKGKGKGRQTVSKEARPSKPRNPRSHAVQAIRDLAQRGKVRESYDKARALMASDAEPSTRSIVSCQIGDTLAKRGRPQTAIRYYASALEMLPDDDPRGWLRPALSEVRALLDAVELDAAHDRADEMWERVQWLHEKWETRVNAITPGKIYRDGPANAGERPHRPSVVASRLAHLFEKKGQPEMAVHYAAAAVEVNPAGATRARQSLARNALAAGDPALAEQHARDSLLVGKYQAKTIHALELFVRARAQQGVYDVPADVLAGFSVSGKRKKGVCRPIYHRAIHALTKAMRQSGNAAGAAVQAEAWMKVAANRREAPSIALELDKQTLADLKKIGGEDRQRALLAYRIFRNPESSPAEMVSGAKEYSRARLASLQQPGKPRGRSGKIRKPKPPTPADGRFIESFARMAEKRFGARVADRVRHAMSLGAMMAQRWDLARPVLKGVIGSLPPTRKQWGQSTWALARMEKFRENYEDAADLYLNFAEQWAILPVFRARALAKWAETLSKSGAVVDGAVIEERARTVLEGVEDYNQLLGLARQFTYVEGANLLSIRDLAANLGVKCAVNAFTAAETPAVANQVFVRLARRQVFDLDQWGELAALWDDLSVTKKTWLSGNSSNYWEIISLVCRSYWKINRKADAALLANSVLSESDVPAHSVALVGAQRARQLKSDGKLEEAYDIWERLADEQPNHRKTAEAHYWLAIRALGKGDVKSARNHALQIRFCYGNGPSLEFERWMDARALIIMHDGDLSKAYQAGRQIYSEKFIYSEGVSIQRDQQIP